ncbi:MAG: SUMF1/EgtB/PvdO family nonheme iron enzyme [Gammaproteobacteria bacterium]|nr:SUMF1/EgtB/PvdO family nonheme iron enzyme [Gammaproteobacteria bacterium]
MSYFSVIKISLKTLRVALVLASVNIACVIVLEVFTSSVLAQQADSTASISPRKSGGFLADNFYLPNDSMLGFVEVPAGTFQMGSNPLIDPMAFENERWSEARRQGAVDLPPFYISRYEVTVAQFSAFVEATGYRADPMSIQGAPDHPVSYVSWTEALAYARWLELQLKESAHTPTVIKELLQGGWRLTLPDEAQWEKAARGTDGRIYPWGNQPRKDRANYSGATTTAVGSFNCPECVYGLSDMSGNVWEWTRSPYQSLPFDPNDDRESLSEEALWVMRGGAFSDAESNARSAVRGAADPGARRPFIGFRLAISRL